MAKPVFKINNVEYTGYITKIAISSNDIDASNAGRSQSGAMRRKRIATKMKLQIEARAMTHAEMVTFQTALSPETVSITYFDPRYSSARTSTFYGSTISSGEQYYDGEEVYWGHTSFNLIEV